MREDTGDLSDPPIETGYRRHRIGQETGGVAGLEEQNKMSPIAGQDRVPLCAADQLSLVRTQPGQRRPGSWLSAKQGAKDGAGRFPHLRTQGQDAAARLAAGTQIRQIQAIHPEFMRQVRVE